MAGPGAVVIGENREREIKYPRRQKDECVISIIKEKVEAADQANAADSWKNVRLHRVPQHLKAVSDDKVYTPQVVSLGPYHHDTASLQQMETHKWRALRRICTRTGKGAEIYFESMEKHAEWAQACYESPSVQRTNEQFAKMMLLDGCFILEILRGSESRDGFRKLGYDKHDPIFSTQRLTQLPIRRDMMMLENQIPLFVLDELFSLQAEDSASPVDIAALAIQFFTQSKGETTQRTGQSKKSSDDVYHLLDVVRRSQFKPESNRAAGERREETILCAPLRELKDAYIKFKKRMTDWRRKTVFTINFKGCASESFSRNSAGPIYCVTELKDANIKIRKQDTGRLWDIKFENGILHIPPIIIDDSTKTFFCNLIASEQCNYKNEVTSCVVFLDQLINSAEDVKYLHKHGIIDHWLGSNDEVAGLINCLCKEVVFHINDSPLSPIYKDINEYYRRPCNAWRATLKRRYFNNPWSIISFVAAVFLLIMTAAQAYFSFYSYYWPPK